MIEKDVEQYLVKKVKALDGTAYKFVSPGNDGVPDRICTLPYGIVVFVETKRPAGKLSAIQKVQIDHLRLNGHKVFILNTKHKVDEFFLRMLESMERRKKLWEMGVSNYEL